MDAKSRFVRYISLFAVVILIAGLLPMVSYARDLGGYDVRSYGEYVTDISFGDDMDTVFLTLPVSESKMIVTVNDHPQESTFDGYMSYYVPDYFWPSGDKIFQFYLYPTNFYFDFGDLPSDTIFRLDTDIVLTDNVPDTFLLQSQLYVGLDKLTGSNGSYSTSRSYKNPVNLTPTSIHGSTGYRMSASIAKSDFSSSAVAGRFFFNPLFRFSNDVTRYDLHFNIHVESYTCQVSMSSLRELEQETGKTNLLLQLLLNRLNDMQTENRTWYQTINDSIQTAIRRICDNVYAADQFIRRSWISITDGFSMIGEKLDALLGFFTGSGSQFAEKVAEAAEKAGEISDGISSAGQGEQDIISGGMDNLDSLPSDLTNMPGSINNYSGNNYFTTIVLGNPFVEPILQISCIFLIIKTVFSGRWWKET